jgi:hypothetical protein
LTYRKRRARLAPFPNLEVTAMFARVASFEGGDTNRLREMNQERQASGSTGMPEGVRRIMVLNDEEGGKRLFVTFFDTREEVDAAESKFDAMGGEVPEDVRGKRTGIEVYEVVFDEAP